MPAQSNILKRTAAHKLQEEIKLQKQSELRGVELSNDDLSFEIAYKSYIDYRDRQ